MSWVHSSRIQRTCATLQQPLMRLCIANGRAAEQFEGEFTDWYGPDDVSEENAEQVTRCAPGFNAWQDPHWLVHRNDVAAFIGEVGYTELAARPEALDQLRLGPLMGGGHDTSRVASFLTLLRQGAGVMLFRCTARGTHLAYASAS